MEPKKPINNRISTGVKEFDEVTFGGFIKNHLYIIKGNPGTGKTTFGVHFLHAGMKNNENTMFISFTMEKNKTIELYEKLGIDLTITAFLDLSPSSTYLSEKMTYDLFTAKEVEEQPIVQLIKEKIEKEKPKRLLIDDITHLQYLMQDTYQYRQCVLALMSLLQSQKVTTLLTLEGEEDTVGLDFLTDGVIGLKRINSDLYLQIEKMRGTNFNRDMHFFEITNEGIKLYPLTISKQEARKKVDYDSTCVVSTGIPQLDEMLSGGFQPATSILVSGPSGTGKTTFLTSFLRSFCALGIKTLVILLEENKNYYINRMKGINIPLDEFVKTKFVTIEDFDVTRNNFAKITKIILQKIEAENIDIVVIDSLSALAYSIPEHLNKLQELIKFYKLLNKLGVMVLAAMEQEDIVGDTIKVGTGFTNLFDVIILLRYFELRGELKRSVGILKKRDSDFQKYIREFQITRFGIKVGEPLKNMRGILTGVPELLETNMGD